jgi:hypothetical protein
MSKVHKLQDLVGIEDVKLGFFQEAQARVEDLRASNRKLEQKQQEVQAILDGIVDLMVVISEEMTILRVNHVYHDLFTQDSPEGTLCYATLLARSEPCPECPVRQAFQTGKVVRSKAVIPFPETTRYFEVVASPLTNTAPSQVLLFMRDVTKEKEYQTQYLQAEKMATVGVLAAGVAHEINNPLTAIRGFSEGIQRRVPMLQGLVDAELVQDMQEYVGTILKECSRCQDIVQNLLTFSRPRNMPHQDVDLKQVVLDCLKVLHYRLKKCPDIRVDLDFQSESLQVVGDQAQLKQVVLNLLTNALDAVGTQGRIGIKVLDDSPEQISLFVEDTGHGIELEHLSRLFDPFFTTKPAGKGTGIGLSTCYNIVSDHGGDIFVCSDQHYGSSFCVKLPKRRERAHV